jgi:DNA polymerase
MNDRLYIDMEVRSATDLKVHGLDAYCADPTTKVMCMMYAFDDGPVFWWLEDEEFPADIMDYVHAGGLVVAHNAQFEFRLWNCVLRRQVLYFAELKLEQMRCTMAKAYAMRLPGSLENALIAIGAEERKDAEGRRITLQLAKPRSKRGEPLRWWTRAEFPEKFQRMYMYCESDVRSERELDLFMADLSPQEQRVWEMDQRINARGIAFDRVAVSAAESLAESEKRRLDAEMQSLTAGYVGTCNSHATLVQWLGMNGVDTPSVDKASVLSLLASSSLPPAVRTALTIRQEAAKSSTAKLDTMLERASADDRLRFILQYHGAGTGRWSGRGVQLHNMVRPKIKPKDVEWIISALKTNDTEGAGDAIRLFYGNPLDQIPQCLRGMLVAAPGHDLLAGDYSNIEGRVTAWVAGEHWKLQAFRDFDAGIGPDIYRLTYSRSFNVPIEQVSKSGEDRQVGKVQELACGYQGWVGAFKTMAKLYNVQMTDERMAYCAGLWRAAHPATVSTWGELQQAAIRAVASPGTPVHVQMPTSPCRLTFLMSGQFLWLQLPSGRALCYPYAEMFTKTREFTRDDGSTFTRDEPAVRYLGEDSITRQWDWQETYGGLWLENIVQAISRDILVAAMVRLEAEGYNVVLHVHDEAVIEVPKSCGLMVAEYCKILGQPLDWAAPGLPIAVGGWRGERYRKE